MEVASPSVRRLLAGTSLALLALGSACTATDQPTSPEVLEVRLAKGGGGKPVQVKDTDPPGTEQGTVDLQVRVLGSGFEDPARVRMLLDGDTTGVVTSEVAEFVSDKELVTTITVAEDATVALWDVEVELLGKRRKGIGIELFEIKTKCLDPTFCDSGGPEPNGQAAWTGSSPDDALSSSEQGVQLSENGRKVEIDADLYQVATWFDGVLALPVVLQDGSQLPIGQCIFRYPDLTGYDPSVMPEEILDVLRNALRHDGLLPVHFSLTIGKKALGEQHSDHFLELRPQNTTEGDMNLLNPDGTLNPGAMGMLHWGKGASAQTKDTWDFLKVELIGGDVDVPIAPRTFRLSEGIVNIFGRLGSAYNAPETTLRCDVPDSAVVTISPL